MGQTQVVDGTAAVLGKPDALGATPLMTSSIQATPPTTAPAKPAVLIGAPAVLRAEPAAGAVAVGCLQIGELILLGATRGANGTKWVAARTTNGATGFIDGRCKVRWPKLYHPFGADVPVFDSVHAPNAARSLKASEEFFIVGNETAGQQTRVKIWQPDQGVGFVPADAKYREISSPGPAVKGDQGQRNILVGGLWCIGGIVFTAATYNNAVESGGGTYFVAWGAILFGGIQFVKGLVEAIDG